MQAGRFASPFRPYERRTEGKALRHMAVISQTLGFYV